MCCQCIEMKEAKVASIAGRKRLNEATKQFRYIYSDFPFPSCHWCYFRVKPTNEQLAMVPDILKSYQDEIDQLSRRAKASEAAFVGIYKALYDGIDPVPVQSLN